MVKQKHITASQELRLKAVHLKQDHQNWSYSKIGKKIGCSHKFVSRWVARHQQGKGVSDQQRSGRPLKADADAQQYIYMAAQLPECSSAADVAAKTQQAKGLKMSPSSITRLLRRKGLQHLTAKVVPMLTARQKLARVRCAKTALRRELCSWRRVMITDSKYLDCILMADQLAGGVHQQPGALLLDPSIALLLMCTWASAIMAPQVSSL